MNCQKIINFLFAILIIFIILLSVGDILNGTENVLKILEGSYSTLFKLISIIQ